MERSELGRMEHDRSVMRQVQAAIAALAFMLLAGCGESEDGAQAKAAPPPPEVTVAKPLGAEAHRMGRVHRPVRAGAAGRDPGPGGRLPAGDPLPGRAERRGRPGAVRHRSAPVPGDGRSRQGSDRDAARPADAGAARPGPHQQAGAPRLRRAGHARRAQRPAGRGPCQSRRHRGPAAPGRARSRIDRGHRTVRRADLRPPRGCRQPGLATRRS